MPNTRPVTDRPERVADLLARAAGAHCRVFPIGAATLDHRNEEFADFAALKAAGCVAVTDDAFPLQCTHEMVAALERAAQADLPFIAHCELKGLSAGGSVDRSAAGIVDAPVQETPAEDAAVRLWAAACERVPAARLHLAHVSSRAAMAVLRALRGSGCRVSAETAPHYLTLSSSVVAELGAAAKMNPPLRSPRDVEAIREALAEGVIDALATDHAPHAPEEKAAGLAAAPFGIIGLETALAVALTELVRPGVLPLRELLAAMTWRPARLLGLPGGRLQVGAPADVTVIDPETEWTVDPSGFHSRGRACPWAGRRLRGRAVATFVAGRLRQLDGAIVSRAASCQ
jgi:dihydroorotase